MINYTSQFLRGFKMKYITKVSFSLLVLHLCLGPLLYAQEEFNYLEEKVSNYTLPSLLQNSKNKIVANKAQWSNRRTEILELFKENVYGNLPATTSEIHYETLKINNNALSGKAISKQIRIFFAKDNPDSYMDMVIYLPSKRYKPVPVFVGLNFKGNQSIHTDNTIILSKRHQEFLRLTNAKQKKLIRGEQAERWELDTLISKGFGVVTAYYGDLELDYPEGWKTGVRTTLQNQLGIKPSEWAAISAWAWGLCRMMDYLETDRQIDVRRVTVIGHSRLGKAALWAGANDKRFATVISNNSGEGGVAISRRWFGETVNRINKNFPHWFIEKYKTFNNNVAALPVDQHMLAALIAPRPLYVASATEDLWSDPKGEFLGAKGAESVYHLFNKKGLETNEIPAVNTSVGKTIRYHIRTGKHNILLFDWLQYIDFVNENLSK